MSEGQAPVSTAAPIRRPEGRLGLRTLILIRWIAVVGQTATILIVHFGFGFALPVLACLSVVALTALSNLMLMFRMPARARLRDKGAALLLGFDMLQLGMLLYLTGGLENPFLILILAPVTVAATILSRGPTLGLTTLAIVLVTLLAFFRTPLPWTDAAVALPFPYDLGVWTALCVASVFIAAYIWSVADEARRMSDALAAAEASLSRAQNVSALGGLAAAAAHELGSPLATIAVVAKELSREVPPDSPFAEDVALLISQSDRCRDILAGLSQRPDMAGHRPLELVRFSALVAQACEVYRDAGVALDIETDPGCAGTEPEAPETSEFMHGVGNLIQNAIQFAAESVELRLFWNETEVRLIVRDDGPGFPASVLASLGEPYISTRSGAEGHMGLGVFIAQTLLEVDGAKLHFANRGGAEVVIRWPRDMFERNVGLRGI
ncbi:MAG: ActS/PrrB/RegB family redox-sensitive histidine kinase [Alphaproteobacteria bacterium]|nr:ActS/PrrB/RegB family redox-sensitive histidine kinase [Alphaproteobacteria bacterium]